jgi:hypothetical protein
MTCVTFVEYADKYGKCWPLLADARTALIENYAELAEIVDVDDDVINAIVSERCFTRRQLSPVKSISDQRVRSKRLLDMLLRSSIDNLERFLHCVKNVWLGCARLLDGSAGNDIIHADNLCFIFILTLNPYQG